MTPPRLLVIAGSDSGGGAGIQADIKTGFALGVHVSTALTAITAQNTVGVHGVWVMDADAVRAQIRAVLDDIGADVIKTGMLGDAAVAQAVADEIERAGLPAVVDPVCISTTGTALLTDAGLEVYRQRLIPMATVVTPNLPEVRALTGIGVVAAADLPAAARAMLSLGARWVLVKGGHLKGAATDLLAGREQSFELTGERIESRNTHGTGCTLATAIAARLAYGDDVPAAARAAKDFVARAISAGYSIGSGAGPVSQRVGNAGEPGPEWSYVDVRRLLLFLEHSIEQGLHWAVFEPNDEQLWSRVRSSVGEYLATQWRDGHLQGDKPEAAFFVRCDRSTMTQADIDNGRLIVEIGVAPLRPAEFVIFRIGQWTAAAPPC